jgi:hypothetical protein
VREREHVVEAWSSERLKFEMRDSWHRDFRDDLRCAIRSLGGGESLIAATYGSMVRDRCDTENILFYNVGASCFTEVARLGIRFERRFDSPSPPDDLAAPALHYHRYERAAPGRPFLYWRERELLGDFSDVALPRLTEETKPVEVWLPVRRAVLEALPDAALYRRSLQPFALRLRLHLHGLGPSRSGSSSRCSMGRSRRSSATTGADLTTSRSAWLRSFRHPSPRSPLCWLIVAWRGWAPGVSSWSAPPGFSGSQPMIDAWRASSWSRRVTRTKAWSSGEPSGQRAHRFVQQTTAQS